MAGLPQNIEFMRDELGTLYYLTQLGERINVSLYKPGESPVIASQDLTGGIKLSSGDVDVLAANGGVFDFVNPSAGIPASAAKGAAISFRSNGAPVVASGGFLTSSAGTGQRAWYAEFPVGQRITRIGAEFKFAAGSGGQTGCIALIPWSASVTDDTDIPPTPLHFTVTRFGWSVGVLTTTNGAIVNVGSGSFSTPLLANTTYYTEAVIDGSTAYLVLPDGSVVTVTDSRIGSVIGTHAGWEFYQYNGATDDLVSIGRFWCGVGDQRVQSVAALHVASRSAARKPSALTLTSVASTAIPTSEASIDAAAVCNVPVGSANKNVLCRLSAWVDVIAGHSIIFVPTFKDIGGVSAQPYLFAVTAPSGGFSGYATVEFVQLITSANPMTCEFHILSTGAGDTITSAANKPATMTFTPLG